MVEQLRGSIFFSMDANLVNMSIDGTAIETTKRLSINEEYTMKIMHSEKLIEIKGKTIWCALNRHVKNEQGDVIPIYRGGLAFSDVLTDKARDLLKFINENRVEKMEKRLLERFSLISQKSSIKIDYPETFTVKAINHSGMSIELDVPIEPESFYNMDIQLDEKIYKFKGKVANLNEVDVKSKNFYLDIDILEMNEDDKEVLSSYISNLPK